MKTIKTTEYEYDKDGRATKVTEVREEIKDKKVLECTCPHCATRFLTTHP